MKLLFSLLLLLIAETLLAVPPYTDGRSGPDTSRSKLAIAAYESILQFELNYQREFGQMSANEFYGLDVVHNKNQASVALYFHLRNDELRKDNYSCNMFMNNAGSYDKAQCSVQTGNRYYFAGNDMPIYKSESIITAIDSSMKLFALTIAPQERITRIKSWFFETAIWVKFTHVSDMYEYKNVSYKCTTREFLTCELIEYNPPGEIYLKP